MLALTGTVGKHLDALDAAPSRGALHLASRLPWVRSAELRLRATSAYVRPGIPRRDQDPPRAERNSIAPAAVAHSEHQRRTCRAARPRRARPASSRLGRDAAFERHSRTS
jgi:hypothetical protein